MSVVKGHLVISPLVDYLCLSGFVLTSLLDLYPEGNTVIILEGMKKYQKLNVLLYLHLVFFVLFVQRNLLPVKKKAFINLFIRVQ